MPQPKSAKSSSPAKKPAAAQASPKTAASASTSIAKTSKKRTGAGKTANSVDAAADAQAARDEALRANLLQLRELLAGGVMLTAQRVQEAMDDAVRRGKMTRRDAEEIARGLVDTGRRQSFDLLAEIEQLLGRSKNDLGTASSLVRGGTDRVLREVDRVRRTAGVGASASFPIEGYDELKAAQVGPRLEGLSAAELRRVREHEQAGAARKSVLAKLDAKLK
ncbi:MAG: plectin [Solirubrobacterales bacterium]|nr:plectin [Solirubrobacterales bacterium]